MPLIAPEDKRPDEQISLRLNPDLAAELRDYSRYCDGSSLHYIASRALRRLFDADKDFRDWRRKNPPSATQPPEGNRRRGRPKTHAAAV